MLHISKGCVEHNRPIAYLTQPTYKKNYTSFTYFIELSTKNHPLLKATEI